jgi:hypothetical protein
MEPDQNKQCNLAICLMHMNRIPEAKSLLQTVKASSGSKPMDDSYAKSFERACQILTELESHLIVKPTEEDEKVHQRSLALPTTRNLKEVASSRNGDVSGFVDSRKCTGVVKPTEKDEKVHQRSLALSTTRNLKEVASSRNGDVSGFVDSRKCTGVFNEDRVLSDEHNRRSYWQNHSENEKSFFASNNRSSQCISPRLRGGPQSSPQTAVDNSWRRDSSFASPGERLGLASKMRDYRFSFAEIGPSSEQKKTFTSPAIHTQPRRCCWGFDKGDQRRIRWGEDTAEIEKENAIRNLSGELLDLTDNHTSWKRNVQENGRQRKSAAEDRNTSLKCSTEQTVVIDNAGVSKASTDCDWDQSAETVGNKYLGKDSSLKSHRKSWADMVEEEEEELDLLTTDLGQSFHSWNYEDACSDENLNVNTFHQNSYQKNQLGTIFRKLEAADLQDGYGTSMNAVSSRNSTARRSLSYESAEDVNTKRRNRLQVFRDITPTPDSP